MKQIIYTVKYIYETNNSHSKVYISQDVNFTITGSLANVIPCARAMFASLWIYKWYSFEGLYSLYLLVSI